MRLPWASSRIRFSNVKRFAINTHKIIADIIPAKILRFAPESGLDSDKKTFKALKNPETFVRFKLIKPYKLTLG